MMISAAQLRAARGLLDWTRSELAKASGLSAETIKNIEHGVYAPQESTINAIVNCFSNNSVEFTEDDGVKVRTNRVKVFSGKNGHIELLDHIYEVLRVAGGRIRQFNLSDGTYLHYTRNTGDYHMDRMSKIANLDARVLLPNDDTSRPAQYCEYKWINENSEKLIPYYVYNDYICMVIFKDDNEVETISIHSKPLADMHVEQFEKYWQQAITHTEIKHTNNGEVAHAV